VAAVLRPVWASSNGDVRYLLAFLPFMTLIRKAKALPVEERYTLLGLNSHKDTYGLLPAIRKTHGWEVPRRALWEPTTAQLALLDAARENRRSLQATAQSLGIGHTTLTTWLERSEITWPTREERNQEIREAYTQGTSEEDLAKAHGLTIQSIRKLTANLGNRYTGLLRELKALDVDSATQEKILELIA